MSSRQSSTFRHRSYDYEFLASYYAICPFAGRLLRWAWLRGSSPSSLTAGTHVSSGHLGHGSTWLDARTGCGKRLLLGFAVFPVLFSRLRGAACASEHVLREGRREPGERLESLCECITFYNWIRLTPILHTVLNYSTTGSRSRVEVQEFCGMQRILWSLQAVQKNMYKTSAIHLNGTFPPWKTLNIMEINGNIEKLCNKNLNWDQAGHFPVGLVSIARKLWEEKPVKKWRNNNNNILDFGITVVCCFTNYAH